MGLIWTDTDDALGEQTNLLSTVALSLAAPSVNVYTLTRLDWVLTVRTLIANTATAVPYWWASAEVMVEAIFSTDGSDPGTGIPGDDKRVLNRYQLVPHVSYAPTAGSYAILWSVDPSERQSKGQRKATVLGALPPSVWWHVSAADQHGVFASGVNPATKVHAVNLSARALWRADF